jgi:hypothetical protein
MTLHEYLNQTEPVKMPTVFLQENEIIRHGTYKKGNDTFNIIEVKQLWQIYGVGSPYIQINDSDCLYTTDSDGNKKSLSCFRVPTKR